MITLDIKKQELIKDKLRKPMLTCNDYFYKMWTIKYKKYLNDCFVENTIQKMYDQ